MRDCHLNLEESGGGRKDVSSSHVRLHEEFQSTGSGCVNVCVCLVRDKVE